MEYSELTERHFNQIQAARYLNKSLRWFQLQLTSANPPPGFKISRSWIFKKSELDSWLTQFRANSDLDKIVDDVMSELGK